MRRAFAALVVVLLLPVAAASAETPTPGPGATAPALPMDLPALAMTFPVASLDGSVTEDGKTITLRADVFFAYNKASLNTKAAAALERAVGTLKELGATTVRVDGHTDSKGGAGYNKGLSRRRAEAVRQGLLAGLPQLTVTARGYGESKPVASNKTGKGRALNRRVVITVTG
ncbi:MAG: OmpA family protein [Micropruina sp.]|uniref:OmpA family protein n=1 Tax=Micropruina sp. TaxID=2737536 RepID=UPI0039E3A6D2